MTPSIWRGGSTIIFDRRWSSWMSKCHVSDMHKSFTPNAMSGTPLTLFRCDRRHATMHVNLHACTSQTRTSSCEWWLSFFLWRKNRRFFRTSLSDSPSSFSVGSVRCGFRGGMDCTLMGSFTVSPSLLGVQRCGPPDMWTSRWVGINCTNTEFHRLSTSADVQFPDAAMQIY
jgi:hypothetical protein